MILGRNNLQGIREKIANLFNQDSTWRLIDAYTPRIYGLLLNSFLIAKFGANLYALPGWVLGVFGLILTILPDPHSYILVRASGIRAQSLYGLTVPILLIKTIFAGVLVLICLLMTTTGNISEPHGQTWYLVAIAALFYGSTEFLWAVLGTVSLANGNVRRTAQIGIYTRVVSIVLLGFFWKYAHIGVGEIFLMTSLPIFIGWFLLSPFSMNWPRIRLFCIHGIVRYAGWMQGISLVTAGLFQMPVIVLGAWPGGDPAMVGVVAFTNRLLMAGFQPFQILQSVVIRDASNLKDCSEPLIRTPLWIVFKAGGAVFAFLSLIIIGFSWESGKLELKALILVAALSLGVAVSIWFRHELAVSLAIKSLRQIFLRGYIPGFLLTILAIPILMSFYGVYGLSFAIAVGWIGLSNSWRWV